MIGRLEKPVLNPAHETLKINLLNITLECKCTQARISTLQSFRIGKNFYYDSLSVIVTFNIPLKIDLDQSVL